MKVIRVFLLLVVFAVGLSGCARYRWYYTFPPGGTQADFQRDEAYCNDYTRTWCATNGTVVISGNRQDWGGQRNVNVSGNRGCGDQQFNNVRNDCMGMKGYTYTLVKVGTEQERTITATSEAKSCLDRGIGYGKQGQHDLAIAEFTKAIEIDPTPSIGYYNRALAYFFKKEYDKSWKDVEKAQSLGYQIPPKFLEDLRKQSGVQTNVQPVRQDEGAEWKNIWQDPKFLYSINTKNTTYNNAVGTVVINIKSVTKDVSGVMQYQPGGKLSSFNNYLYHIDIFEIDCANKKVKESADILDYDSQRNVFFYRKAGQGWNEYPAQSLIGEASNIVCK